MKLDLHCGVSLKRWQGWVLATLLLFPRDRKLRSLFKCASSWPLKSMHHHGDDHHASLMASSPSYVTMMTHHQVHNWKCHSLDLLLLLLLDGFQFVRGEEVGVVSNALGLPALLPPVLPRQQLLPYQRLRGLRQDGELDGARRAELRLRHPLVCHAEKSTMLRSIYLLHSHPDIDSRREIW